MTDACGSLHILATGFQNYQSSKYVWQRRANLLSRRVTENET